MDSTNKQHSPSRLELLRNIVDHHSLYVLSQGPEVSGPNYTYFSKSTTSTLDYIITSTSIFGNVINCFVHPIHPLNLSDHLPITVSLVINYSPSSKDTNNSTIYIDWRKITEEQELIYKDAVGLAVEPLIGLQYQTINELESEISFITHFLTLSAREYLPTYIPSKQKKKPWFKDSELTNLSKESKNAWRVWNGANRPTSGPIYDEMKTSKKNIRKRIRHLRATSVRKSIKHFDDLFRSRSHHRFKLSKLVNSYCNKIRTSNGIVK